ncbi:MAG: hypothetical protein RR581_06910 [Eubacterium sp.]
MVADIIRRNIEEVKETDQEIKKIEQQAIATYGRGNLLEEKADCYIMLMQLDLFFGNSLQAIDAKIARLKERMDKDDKNNSPGNPTKQ